MTPTIEDNDMAITSGRCCCGVARRGAGARTRRRARMMTDRRKLRPADRMDGDVRGVSELLRLNGYDAASGEWKAKSLWRSPHAGGSADAVPVLPPLASGVSAGGKAVAVRAGAKPGAGVVAADPEDRGTVPGRPPRPCGRSLANGAACRRPARRSVANCCFRWSLSRFSRSIWRCRPSIFRCWRSLWILLSRSRRVSSARSRSSSPCKFSCGLRSPVFTPRLCRTDLGELPNYRTHKHALFGRQEGH